MQENKDIPPPYPFSKEESEIANTIEEPSNGICEIKDHFFSMEYERVVIGAKLLHRILATSGENPDIYSAVKCDIIPQLTALLSRHNSDPALKLTSMWALNVIGYCDMRYKDAVVDGGAVPLLVQLLSSPDVGLQLQCIWAVGHLSKDSWSNAYMLRDMNCLSTLLEITSRESQTDIVRFCSWAICKLLQIVSLKEDVATVVQVLTRFLQSMDVETVINAAFAISYIGSTPEYAIQIAIDQRILPILFSFLQSDTNCYLYVPALRALQNIFIFSSTFQDQKLVDANIISVISDKITKDKDNWDELCLLLLCIMSGNKDQIEAVLDSKACIFLMETLQSSKNTELIDAFSVAITNVFWKGNEKQIMQIVSYGVLFSENVYSKYDIECIIYNTARRGFANIMKLLLPQVPGNDKNIVLRPKPLIYASMNGHLSIIELLLDYGANINMTLHDGTTALFWAAANGHATIVEELLKRGASIHDKSTKGRSSVCISSLKGADNVVELLLSHGAHIEDMTACGRTPLILAAHRGHLSLVALLLDKGAKIDVQDHEGIGALIGVCQKGNASMVQLLLNRGADIHLKCKNGWDSLCVSSYEGHLNIVELLLSHDSSRIDSITNEGHTPLMLAATKNHTSIVKLLVSKGANISKEDEYGRKAIAYATNQGNLDMMEFMLSHGASIESRGYPLLTIAAETGNLSTVQFLLDKGADIDVKCKTGATALHYACEKDHISMVQLLISRGANIHEKNSEGQSALYVAADKGFLGIAELLLSHGARVDDETDYKRTPLLIATIRGHYPLVKLLLNYGANANAASKFGVTVLDQALEHNCDIIELLLSRGANINHKNDGGFSAICMAARRRKPDVVQFLACHGANYHDVFEVSQSCKKLIPLATWYQLMLLYCIESREVSLDAVLIDEIIIGIDQYIQ